MTSPLPSPARGLPRLIGAGDSLPPVTFRRLAAPGTIAWTQGPMASVIFVPHRGRCRPCARYADQLATAVAGLAEWATRAMIVVDAGQETAFEAEAELRGVFLLADHGGVGRARLGVGDTQAAVVQADRWGAVYQAAGVGPDASHDRELPAPAALVGLAQYIDIQCPECGIPSKEWLASTPFPLG